MPDDPAHLPLNLIQVEVSLLPWDFPALGGVGPFEGVAPLGWLQGRWVR